MAQEPKDRDDLDEFKDIRDKPDPVPNGHYDDDLPKPPQQQTLMQRLMPVLIAVVASLVIVMFYSNANLVSKNDFTTNISQVVSDIGTVKTKITDVQQTMVGLQQVVAELDSPSDEVATLSTSITNIQGSVGSLQSDINTLKSSIPNTSPLQADINSLQDAVTSLHGQLSDINTTMADLRHDITALENATPTPTPTPTSTPIPVAISDFTPKYGLSGTVITIVGAGYVNGQITNVSINDVSVGFDIISTTEIHAVVNQNVTTGLIKVWRGGSVAVSAEPYTVGTSGGSNTPMGNVKTSFSPTGLFALPNSVNINITNNTGSDIFGGQLSLTIQYLNATPSTENMVALSSTDIIWNESGSISGLRSLTKVGDTMGVFLLNGQTKIIIVDVAPPPSGTQFRITNVTYTGWLQ